MKYFSEKDDKGNIIETGGTVCETWKIKPNSEGSTSYTPTEETDYEIYHTAAEWSTKMPTALKNFRIYSSFAHFKYTVIDDEMKGEMVDSFSEPELVKDDFIRFIPINVKKLMAYHVVQTMLKY